MLSPQTPKSVLVIGGGPSGLTALRNLVERGHIERVGLVERRDEIGGVWYINQDDPGQHQAHSKPRWPSPAYPGLVGNIVPQFLSISECPFPDRSIEYPHQPFPTLDETCAYLRSFAEPFIKSGHIRLNWEVTRVEEQDEGGSGGGKGWKVYLRNWNRETGEEEDVEYWDAVVVAVGWYDNPVWPDTDGLDELKSKGLAMHAKDWKGPKGYEDKRVLIVGNAASSNDIAAYLAPVAKAPIFQSIRRPAFPGFPSLPDDRIKMTAPVVKYSIQETSPLTPVVEATLNDGTVISDIDVVLFGTGYGPYPSFVHVLKQDNDNPSRRLLAPLASRSIKPYRVPSIHRHILYAYNPTLAFIGLPMSFTPFTIADIASTWLALAWSQACSSRPLFPETTQGRLEFERERLKTLEEWLSKTENPTSFLAYSVLASDEQNYASQLRKDVVDVRPDLDGVLPMWSDEKTKEREAMYPLKLQVLQYEKDHAAGPGM
ncbi:hypothetical protein APHAL10511_008400 [Amanita phalloides]|nr:hypothetical protein APHAL10511_008400 [Amanita phalloides]